MLVARKKDHLIFLTQKWLEKNGSSMSNSAWDAALPAPADSLIFYF